jgi:hypothetical protein
VCNPARIVSYPTMGDTMLNGATSVLDDSSDYFEPP